MSIGFGGTAKLALQDENTLVYVYSPYNLNSSDYKNIEHIYDGVITIDRNALVEPDIRQKVKRMPSGRKKLITKRVRTEVDFESLLETGRVTVENSRYCWKTLNSGCGLIAMYLIIAVFDRYQDEGIIPEKVSYHV